MFPLKHPFKKAPFHGDQPENLSRSSCRPCAFMGLANRLQVPAAFVQKGSPAQAWRLAALRSSLAGLARHLLDEGRTAASERLFGQKMPLSMLQPPSRGFQGKLENQPRRAREKELLLNSHKTATDFIFNSKDSCKDTSLYFFLIIPSVSCLTYHQTSMHLNPGYEPEAKLGAGGR